MFNGAGVSDFNTFNVIDMGSMFREAVSFTQSLDDYDTSKVTNMENMFDGATQFDGLTTPY